MTFTFLPFNSIFSLFRSVSVKGLSNVAFTRTYYSRLFKVPTDLSIDIHVKHQYFISQNEISISKVDDDKLFLNYIFYCSTFTYSTAKTNIIDK